MNPYYSVPISSIYMCILVALSSPSSGRITYVHTSVCRHAIIFPHKNNYYINFCILFTWSILLLEILFYLYFFILFSLSSFCIMLYCSWEIIDMVRFTSTERAKQGEEEGSAKFARGNRLSISEQIRCYKEECQRIFDLQNRVLSNSELLSSDEEVSSEDDEDEVTGTDSGQRSTRNIESVLSSQMNSKYADGKTDEKDRVNLKRALESGVTISFKHETAQQRSSMSYVVYDASSTAAGTILDLTPPWPNANKKMLRIMRTYSEDGHQYTRTELVPWSPVVEIYLKIRQTRDDDFIHNFVDSDNHFREQQRKEKRRLQVINYCKLILLFHL
ncbi:unnamed protein product [Schistosoma mattheei]|uniref:Uncharacterized protein n=1 Tax=Schistosoma mattheei TaxID=31246 RepID=A0A183NJN4_9TREM|nr:unnamed protein product [Schistosoma mattheei]